MSRHQRYLEVELDLIRAEWAKGTPVKKIAAMIDRDQVALRSKIHAMHLPLRRVGARMAGGPPAQGRGAKWTSM